MTKSTLTRGPSDSLVRADWQDGLKDRVLEARPERPSDQAKLDSQPHDKAVHVGKTRALATVVNVFPLPNALNVPNSVEISGVFNEEMDASTLNNSTVRVWGILSGLHATTITYDPALRKITVLAVKPYFAGETVSANLSTGVKTITGQAIIPFNWQFIVTVAPSTATFAVTAEGTSDGNPIGDLNGDGYVDLALFVGGSVTVYLNNGNGTFQRKGTYSLGVGDEQQFAADLDNDGDIDLVGTTHSFDRSRYSVLLNNGDGSFQPPVTYSLPHNSRPVGCAGDFDGDGYLDLAFATGNLLFICTNDRNGTFHLAASYPEGDPVNSIFAADFNNDGAMDVAVGMSAGGIGSAGVFLQQPDGTFQGSSGGILGNYSNGIFGVDLDGDHDVDIVEVGCGGVHDGSLLLNNGDGTFGTEGSYGRFCAISGFAGDLDGDGSPEVCIVEHADTYATSFRLWTLFRNTNFSLPVGGAVPADIDGDGDLDLISGSAILKNVNACTMTGTATAPGTGASGTSVPFASTATSVLCNASPSFDWNFGDGSPHSSAQNPVHTYPRVGIYAWTLTISAPGASSYIKTGRITIGAPSQYCLNTSVPTGGGTIGANPTGLCYSPNTSVTLTAAADPGFRFDGWSGDASGTLNPLTLTMTKSKNVSASFVPVMTSLSGQIRVFSNGNGTWPLNGSGIVSLIVKAAPSGQTVGACGTGTVCVNAINGNYTFSNLAPVTYDLRVDLTYEDDIQVGTVVLFPPSICPQRRNELKITSLSVNGINPAVTPHRDITFAPPLVMVHGINSCYEKFYDPDQSADNNLWDHYARSKGFITFTPNYNYLLPENSWQRTAQQVQTQIETDLRSLTARDVSSSYPPWVYLGHSMGGLVGRVIAGGSILNNESTNGPLIRSLLRMYQLGTPNSGATIDVGVTPALNFLGPVRVKEWFNNIYPSFGVLGTNKVSVYAGRKGWLFFDDWWDKVVSADSVFNIRRAICIPIPFGPNPLLWRWHCEDVESVSLDALPDNCGRNKNFDHFDLGSPASRCEILTTRILPLIPGAPPIEECSTCPNSATSSRPSETQDSVIALQSIDSKKVSLSPSQTRMVSLTVGSSDLLLINITTSSGAVTFSLIDPNGQVIDFTSLPPSMGQHAVNEFGDSFALGNPAPGVWTLGFAGGASGAEYRFRAAENSPIGLGGFVATPSIAFGEGAHLIAQWSGSSTGITSPVITAQVSDEGDLPLAAVDLHDDGAHGDGVAGDGVFGGDTLAINSAGRFTVTFNAEGMFNGQLLKRWIEASLDVVSSTHIFTGDFNDGVYDSDADGKYDTLQEGVVVNVPAPGNYLASADLEDAQGYLIDHAVGHLEAAGAGAYSISMAFKMSDVFCGEYAAPFSIKNLTLSDAGSLKALDIWTASVTTQTYDGSLFGCAAGTPTPTITSVQPGAMFPGDSKQVIINGKSFQSGAQVSLGAGVNVSSVMFGSSTMLIAQVAVSANATPGTRDATITNPDGHSFIGSALFNVASDQPPNVSINNVTDGQTVTGIVTVSATATDDIGIQKVEFYLDGVLQTSDTTFPYQFVWNTNASSNAPHTLLAKAYDTANHTTTAQINVNVSCVTTYSPSSLFFPLNGGSGSINVSSANACSWEVTTSDAWISITSAGTGSGSDVVTFEIRENFTASARTGTLSIGGKTVTIVQDGGLGEDCQYSISPAFNSFSASGGTGTIQVVAAERCAWQATSSQGWITITSAGIGIGNGTVNYSVGANPGPSGRAGTITVAGPTFAVKQKGN